MHSSWISVVPGGRRFKTNLLFRDTGVFEWMVHQLSAVLEWELPAHSSSLKSLSQIQGTRLFLVYKTVCVCVCVQAWCSHLCKLFAVICIPLPHSPPLCFSLASSSLLSLFPRLSYSLPPLFLQPPLAPLFTHLYSLCAFLSLSFHSCFSISKPYFPHFFFISFPLLSSPSLKKPAGRFSCTILLS